MLWIDLAGAVLGIGLIFFIINRALRFIKNNRRAFINLGLGLFLALLFFLAWYFDQKNQTSEALLAYLFYIAASIAHGFIGFASIMFPKLAYLKQRTTSKVYYQEYLYVLLRTEEQIFLFKKAKHLGGFVYKLKKTDYHDDVLKTLCTKWGVKTSIMNQGKMIINQEKTIYHAYLLFVSKPMESANWLGYSIKDPSQWPNDPFEREMMLRLNLQEPFKIEK